MNDDLMIAKEALMNYEITYQSIDLIGHSANTIYKILDTNHEFYSLRLHRSKSESLESFWTTRKVIESEMIWLDSFNASSGVVLPSPYQNIHGEYMTEVNDIACTLLKWVEGEHKTYITSFEEAASVGEMIGKLHLHASTWKAPSEFERPSFDPSRIAQSIEKIHEQWIAGLLRTSEVEMLEQAGQRVIQMMNSINRTTSNWGMIHADLIPSNFVFYGTEARPIDFGACGWGFYLFDLGWTFSYIHPAFRQQLLESYSKYYRLPHNAIERLEGFFIAGQLDTMNFWWGLPDAHEWLPNHIRKFVSREVQSYLNHEPFLFRGTPYWE